MEKRRAQALVEAALVFPVLLLLVLFLLDVGLALDRYIKVNNGAREGARYAIADPERTTSQIAGAIQAAVHPLLSDLSAEEKRERACIIITRIRTDRNGNIESYVTEYAPGFGTATDDPVNFVSRFDPTTVQERFGQDLTGEPDEFVLVEVVYKHKPILLAGEIPMRAYVFMRMAGY